MTLELDELFVRLKRYWSESGIHYRPEPLDMREFEERYSVRIPPDFARFLNEVGGMDEEAWDEPQIRFLPLAEIRPVVAEFPDRCARAHAGLFVFADYLLWSHGYALRLEGTSNEVVLVGGPSPTRIAASFHEFLAIYLSSPMKLFP